MSQSNRCRRLSVAPLAGVERRGHGALGSGSLAVGMSHSLPSGSRFIQGTHPFSGVLSQFDQGQRSGGRGPVFAGQGSDRACSASLSGLLQPVVCSDESLGAWRPVIDLSFLNLRIQQTSFKMETLQSVLLSVRPGDWMVSLDLQVPMHPESRKFLRFMVGGTVYQFKVLCFGLSTAPQVFTRVMAPVSGILHRMGVWLRRYLDDWLLQASSRELVLLALRIVLRLCRSLGIAVNWEKSQMIPSQRMVYLGVILYSISFRASPALKRVEKLLSIGDVFLSCARQPVSSWLELLGVLSSLIQLVPGGLSSLLCGGSGTILVEWSQEIRQDLDWWLDRNRLELGISLEQVSPQLELWAGGLIWTKVLLPAFGLQRKSSLPSTSGSYWPSRELSCGLLRISSVLRWQSSPTIPRPLLTYGTKAVLTLFF